MHSCGLALDAGEPLHVSARVVQRAGNQRQAGETDGSRRQPRAVSRPQTRSVGFAPVRSPASILRIVMSMGGHPRSIVSDLQILDWASKTGSRHGASAKGASAAGLPRRQKSNVTSLAKVRWARSGSTNSAPLRLHVSSSDSDPGGRASLPQWLCRGSSAATCLDGVSFHCGRERSVLTHSWRPDESSILGYLYSFAMA